MIEDRILPGQQAADGQPLRDAPTNLFHRQPFGLEQGAELGLVGGVVVSLELVDGALYFGRGGKHPLPFRNLVQQAPLDEVIQQALLRLLDAPVPLRPDEILEDLPDHRLAFFLDLAQRQRFVVHRAPPRGPGPSLSARPTWGRSAPGPVRKQRATARPARGRACVAS